MQEMRTQTGFTLVEMLIAFVIGMTILGTFYMMQGTFSRRLIKVIQKSQGQQAVRLLTTKMRIELKSAIGVEDPNPNDGLTDSIRIYLGRHFGHENFSIEYSYVRDRKAIQFVERDGDRVIQEGLFLGGQTQILGFYAASNDINEQILTQKHRVSVTIEYFDTTKRNENGRFELLEPQAALLSVYPRYTNMKLKIDVPQG